MKRDPQGSATFDDGGVRRQCLSTLVVNGTCSTRIPKSTYCKVYCEHLRIMRLWECINLGRKLSLLTTTAMRSYYAVLYVCLIHTYIWIGWNKWRNPNWCNSQPLSCHMTCIDLDWWTLLFPKAALVPRRASEVHTCMKYCTNCKTRQYNAQAPNCLHIIGLILWWPRCTRMRPSFCVSFPKRKGRGLCWLFGRYKVWCRPGDAGGGCKGAPGEPLGEPHRGNCIQSSVSNREQWTL